ncbi:MAG TPA: DUF6786 family protein [Puia sp.]|nr:DUF6786 family protein [Puia sp.]
MNKQCQLVILLLTLILFGCGPNESSGIAEKKSPEFQKGTFGYDAAFLKKNLTGLIELADSNTGAKVLLCASYQGRVLTSAANDNDYSFGWINYDLISTQKKKAQFNPIGGEERFWIGPEGGQNAFYFKKGDSFNIAHWQVPAIIDTLPYNVSDSNASGATFTKDGVVTNYSGNSFHINIIRSVHILSKSSVENQLQVTIPQTIKFVAYESINAIKNSGDDWKRETGLPSIWLLSMMTPSNETGVYIPFEKNKNSRLYITDNYFGVVPADRLVIKDSVLFLKCDGKYRSKIGLSPAIAKPFAASFDFKRNILSILHFEIDKRAAYVNSKWEMQKEPFKGDVINSYNDGPLADGSQLGPFYEIESSSPAKELRKGESLVHRQMICHFEGDYRSLNTISKKLLGIDLDEIKSSLHL